MDAEVEFESEDYGTLHDVVLEFDGQESDPSEDAAHNLDWESFLATHPPRHCIAIIVLVEGGSMRDAGKRCGLTERAALILKR